MGITSTKKLTAGMRWVRLLQIFSAKLVLEVFGGAGAIWGFSEVLTLRKPETLWFWRPCAAAVGAIFFLRFILQLEDYKKDIEKELVLAKEKIQSEYMDIAGDLELKIENAVPGPSLLKLPLYNSIEP